MSVHAAVPEVVWCPANIIEMNMPVTWSAVKRSVPSSFLIDIRTSSRSIVMRWFGRRGTIIHDRLHERNQLDARCITPTKTLDVGIRVDVGQGVGATFKVVIELRKSDVEGIPKSRPDQTGR